jgi:hypothetical protein
MTLVGVALAPRPRRAAPRPRAAAAAPASLASATPTTPLYGNGGYDVGHYLLNIRYNPATDRLVGVATISARATQNLCRFNLDFQG